MMPGLPGPPAVAPCTGLSTIGAVMNPVVPGDGELGSGQEEARRKRPCCACCLALNCDACARPPASRRKRPARNPGVAVQDQPDGDRAGRVEGPRRRGPAHPVRRDQRAAAGQGQSHLARRQGAGVVGEIQRHLLPDWFETYPWALSQRPLHPQLRMQFVPGLFQTEDYARAVTTLGHQARARR